MNGYTINKLNEYKVMKLVDELHEVMEFIDDGYHNEEIVQLTKISNELIDSLKDRG